MENYIKVISNKSTSFDDFFKNIEWSYLANYLNVGDKTFLQMKVDEIYEEQYTERASKNETSTIIDNWNNKENAAYKEVTQMILNLGLQDFETNSIPIDRATVNDTREEPHNDSKINNTSKVDEHKGNAGHLPIENNALASSQIDRPVKMPTLSNSERRTSLDLLHTTPRLVTDHSDNIYDGTPNVKRFSSLSKPAATRTSNVNVITKADVNIEKRAKKEVRQFNERFQDFLRKIKVSIRRPIESPSTTRSPLIDQLDRRLSSSHAEGNSIDNANKINPALLEPKTRRTSMVGDNLPLYIKKQLEAVNPEENDGNQRNTTTKPNNDKSEPPKSPQQVSKNRSRIHNLLANSQSLYSHSRDVSSINSEVYQDETTNASNNSEGTEELDHEHEDDSEDDKEYILPNLLTRYYGIGEDDEEGENILRGIEGIAEDTDFINVNGNYDSAEEQDDYNDDEDYLFKI